MHFHFYFLLFWVWVVLTAATSILVITRRGFKWSDFGWYILGFVSGVMYGALLVLKP